MLITQPYCPLCLSRLSARQFLASSKIYSDVAPIELNICVCANCKAYYLGEYVKEDSIGDYYPSSYYTKSKPADKSSFSYRVRNLSYSFFKGYPVSHKNSFFISLAAILYGFFFWHRWGRFPKYTKSESKPSALEIGYGAGRYLKDLNILGWECAGIDIEQSNAEELNDLGITVAPKLASLDFKRTNIDYIYSYHAFEHIYDIDTVMEQCHSMLSQDGVFKLCVPISDGFLPKFFKKYWYDLGVPIHKQIFSIRGVHHFCKRHGFKVKSYKYNSYSESFAGSLIALFIGLKNNSDLAAQDFSHGKTFKIMCLMLSPIVLFLDFIRLGDRAEFELIKK